MDEPAARLCAPFARTGLESAVAEAADGLRDLLGAELAAMLYSDAAGRRFCRRAGSDAALALAEDQWRRSAAWLPIGPETARFGPWTPPGWGPPLPHWLACALGPGGADSRGCVFLGRAADPWGEDDEERLAEAARSIAPAFQLRLEREVEERARREAEERLVSSERRLRTFLEGSRDMIYTADAADVVTGINASGIVLLGRADKSEIVGRPYVSFALNREDRAQLLRRVQEVGYAADYEIVLRRGDGSNVFCLETAYAIRDEKGSVVELQGIVKDITDRISSESALWKTNVELADANLKIQKTQTLMVQHEKLASIGQLAAGVAHEINNPLGFLKSNQQMIGKYLKTIVAAWSEAKATHTAELEEIERRLDLDYILSEIDSILSESNDGFDRIMHIVANLKSFSRIEQGAAFKPYDLNAGIESTLVVARNEIKYVADVKKDLGEIPLILARGSEINQVVLNILVNAAQAIESQKRGRRGLIEISTSAAEGRVVVSIRDDGPGIPEELRHKIFDPFFTTKEPGKGTGLGLSISYDIVVSKHGGRLRVESAPGRGSVFTIELPIKGPPEPELSGA